MAEKKKTKAGDTHGKTGDELNDDLVKLKKEQFNLRFQRANGQLEKTNRIREVRRSIARIETKLTEQRRKAG
jgi:large subunit ribosomal protein L29